MNRWKQKLTSFTFKFTGEVCRFNKRSSNVCGEFKYTVEYTCDKCKPCETKTKNCKQSKFNKSHTDM